MSFSKSAALLGAIAAMGFPEGMTTHERQDQRARREKNKYGLTDDQKEIMSEMTPKEKKKFLKGLREEKL